jgi:hypothetical protein
MQIIKSKLILFGILLSSRIYAQEDLLSLVDQKDEGPHKVYATFKTTRIGNAQSIETVKNKHLDFKISHRFGNITDANQKNPINYTGQNFLGFDNASDIRFSFDYGLTENITLGIGRSRMKHIIDGNIKWKILQQTSDFRMPISLAFFTSTGYSHDPMKTIYGNIVKDFKSNELHRFSFFNELIIACKVNDKWSLELLPSYMYRNYIIESVNAKNNAADVNGFFTLGVGGRVKISKRSSIVADFYYNFAKYYQNNSSVFMPLSLGYEVETGGHVFTLLFTNAPGLIENNYIPYTTDTWTKGQVKFGFCISRTFAL